MKNVGSFSYCKWKPQARLLSVMSVVVVGLMALLNASQADASQRQRARDRAPSRASSQITVPVDIGVGPAGVFFNGPVGAEQPLHFGLRLSITAIIDREFATKHQRLIPRQYRRQIRQMTEIRYRPAELALIPSSLMLSPKVANTGVYGATWRWVGLGIAPIDNPVRVGLGAGVIFTYAYMHSETLFSSMHFLRPGVELTLDFEVPVTQNTLLSAGWASQLYIPQTLNGSILEVGGFNNSIWHIGQAFLKLHYRFPYTTSL